MELLKRLGPMMTKKGRKQCMSACDERTLAHFLQKEINRAKSRVAEVYGHIDQGRSTERNKLSRAERSAAFLQGMGVSP